MLGYLLSHSDSLGIIERDDRLNGMLMQIPAIYGRALNDIVESPGRGVDPCRAFPLSTGHRYPGARNGSGCGDDRQ
jgi:hypothetical protein